MPVQEEVIVPGAGPVTAQTVLLPCTAAYVVRGSARLEGE